MSCWVVPSIAAEIWGVSIEQILRKIASGELACREESGWTFVDVAPEAEMMVPRRRPEDRPPTYTPITDEEMAALAGDDAMGEENDDDGIIHPRPASPGVPGEEEVFEEASTFKHWGTARHRTSRLRVPPPKFAVM